MYILAAHPLMRMGRVLALDMKHVLPLLCTGQGIDGDRGHCTTPNMAGVLGYCHLTSSGDKISILEHEARTQSSFIMDAARQHRCTVQRKTGRER